MSGDKKIQIINEVDAFILPSYNEGLPISILEAMSYNLPIISTSVGGIPEILKNGYNGFLIRPGDKKALKNAILTLINNPSLRKEMGKHSQEMVQPFLPTTVEGQLRTLYKELLV